MIAHTRTHTHTHRVTGQKAHIPSEVSRESEAPPPKVNLTPSSLASSSFALAPEDGSPGNRSCALLVTTFTAGYHNQCWLSHSLLVTMFTAGYHVQCWLSHSLLVTTFTAGYHIHCWLSHSLLVIMFTADYHTHCWLSHALLVITVIAGYHTHCWLSCALLFITYTASYHQCQHTHNQQLHVGVSKKSVHVYNCICFYVCLVFCAC